MSSKSFLWFRRSLYVTPSSPSSSVKIRVSAQIPILLLFIIFSFYQHLISSSLITYIVLTLVPIYFHFLNTSTSSMERSGGSLPSISSHTPPDSSSQYSSQTAALHTDMGGPHPSATHPIHPASTNYSPGSELPPSSPPARPSSYPRASTATAPRAVRPPPPLSPQTNPSPKPASEPAPDPDNSLNRGTGSVSQFSPQYMSQHAQTQGLHMGMAGAAQPVSPSSSRVSHNCVML